MNSLIVRNNDTHHYNTRQKLNRSTLNNVIVVGRNLLRFRVNLDEILLKKHSKTYNCYL